MKANVGGLDRAARLVIAAGAVYLFFTGERPNWEYGALAAGVILGLTAITGFCPLYRLIGVNTCRKKSA
ncbi:MAG: DUF2892 domain-containing protein [Parvularculaceae bacterium]|nr:DUF2892 domain-containing protein [Parvularculaceae bacterium]